jgi:hypothetical protein
MAVSLKHTTEAVGTDAGNGEIRKAQWNEEHTLTLATDRLLGRATAGAGAVEEITCTAAGRNLIDDADAAAQRTTLGLVIGTNVQAWDADLDTWATKTAPSGVVVGTTDTQTLSGKTLTDPLIDGAIAEEVFTISDGAAFEIDPSNGTMQNVTLGASRTPKATNFAAGESVTLRIKDGTAYTITWTDATFGGSGVVWVGGSAPTLDTTNWTVVVLWKEGSQVYGKYIGTVV